MAQIILVRHGQASFGAADYDVLSPLGHEQARALGHALAAQGETGVARVFTGAQRRHRETLAGLKAGLEDAGHRNGAFDPAAVTVHEGLNEFDSKALFAARFGPDGLPPALRQDHRGYFRTLHETVIAWQQDALENPPETWAAFSARVLGARDAMLAAAQETGGQVLAVSSGGAISRLIIDVLGAPAEQMIHLQLQMRNCAVSRLAGSARGLYLQAFNEALHLRQAADARLATYA